MVKTWVAVNLIACGKLIAIPMKYIYTMNRWHAYNRRINRNQTYLIFYSENHNKTPNWYLNVRNVFSRTVEACYHARLLKCFGKWPNFHNLTFREKISHLTERYFLGTLDDANDYITRRRNIPPALYNPRRLKENPTPQLTPAIQLRNSFDNSTTTSQNRSSSDPSTSSHARSISPQSYPNSDGQHDSTPDGGNSPPSFQDSEYPTDYDDSLDSNNESESSTTITPHSQNLVRSSSNNQLVPLRDVTNVARLQPNENVQRVLFSAFCQWFQRGMDNRFQFSHDLSTAPISQVLPQRAILGRTDEQEDTENVLF